MEADSTRPTMEEEGWHPQIKTADSAMKLQLN